jgi:hypothetical protein
MIMRKSKKLPLNVKIFIIIAIILGLAIILSGIPEMAKFAAPQAGIVPAPTPIQGTCSGTPNPCSEYDDLQSCVELAGCAFVESLSGMACTNVEGPAACDTYENQNDCSGAGCEWQAAIVRPNILV